MIDIFKELNRLNICYSVNTAWTRFKSCDTDLCSKDYYILAHEKDLAKLETIWLKKQNGKEVILDFNQSEEKHYDTIEYTLDREQVSFFMDRLDEFTKVSDNVHGKVYELKNNSFKDYYNENKGFRKHVKGNRLP